MKTMNLFSIIDAKNNLKEEIFKSYLNRFQASIKDSELEDLESFVKQVLSCNSRNIAIGDGFFVGHRINQISKEFDLLRIGQNSIINIELKKINTGTEILNQLIENKHYLSFLGKEMNLFTYVAQDNQLLHLNKNCLLEEVDANALNECLENQKLEDMSKSDIQDLFNPSNYLVSPFNSTEAFLGDRYFLTDLQKRFKKQIFALFESEELAFVSISGPAGTGKTLLAYDIAKEALNRKKRILIIHCGYLNDGHRILKRQNWNILSIRDLFIYNNFEGFDLVILDECQRIYKQQLERIIKMTQEARIKCIFAFDGNQWLHETEMRNAIPERIKELVAEDHSFKLTEKVRSNKELAAFTKHLFDKSKRNPTQSYKNISLQYFHNDIDAKKYMYMLADEGWKSIRFTPSNFSDPYQGYQVAGEDNAHRVIGQEYDNVVVVIDKYFLYDENGILTSRHHVVLSSYYRADKMLFQMITRARNKLNIVIINNETVLQHCLNILSN